MREAFNRLVRELQDEGAPAELRTLAAKYQGGPEALRIASLVLLLEALLEDKAPFEETLARCSPPMPRKRPAMRTTSSPNSRA